VAVDPSGDAWFGGSDRSTRFRYISSTGDMSRPNYWRAQTLTEAKDSAWNRFDIWPDAVGEPQTSRPEQRTSDNISSISLTSDGNVWVGSFSRGLAEMTREGGVLRQFSTELVDGKGYVSSVAADPLDNSVWAGTSWGGGISRVRDNTIMHYNHTVFGLDLAMSRVSDIQVDTSGIQRRVLVAFMGYKRTDDGLWVAGSIGIYTGD
jgi:ligand-binding sensor domain-containing protein